MPVSSKMDFCDTWAAGRKRSSSDNNGKGGEESKRERRIPLPWELLQPSLRILGHCLLGGHQSKELFQAASSATKSLYERSLNEVDDAKAMATSSLVRLDKMASDPKLNVDRTEIQMANVLSV